MNDETTAPGTTTAAAAVATGTPDPLAPQPGVTQAFPTTVGAPPVGSAIPGVVPPATAAPAIDLNALAALVVPQLVDALGPAFRQATQVAQAGQNPAPAADAPTWGEATGSFVLGEVVTHGYWDHREGVNVVRKGIVTGVRSLNDVDGQGNQITSEVYDVGWLSDDSANLPAASLRTAASAG